MYEVILHLKSGKAINVGLVDEDEAKNALKYFQKVKWNGDSHAGGTNGFHYSFHDVEVLEFKEAANETVS